MYSNIVMGNDRVIQLFSNTYYIEQIKINMSVHLLKSSFAFPLLFVVNKAWDTHRWPALGNVLSHPSGSKECSEE